MQTQSHTIPGGYPLRGIDNPGMNDVLCGRGGGTNNHVGNIRFRQLVNGHKLRYLAATKSEKPMVSREVVAIWRNLNPPGRFLAQEKGVSVCWNDVGDKKAREKASQCLRERTPDVMPFVKKLELQLTLEEQEKASNLANGISSLSQPEESVPVSVSSTIATSSARAVSVSLDSLSSMDKCNDADQCLTSSDITRHLLHQQKEAAIAAHEALNVHIPPDLIHSVSPSTALIASSNSVAPTPLNTTSSSITVNTHTSNEQSLSEESFPVTTLSMERERISKEIADLELQKARLQAEIEEKKMIEKISDNISNSSGNSVNYADPNKRPLVPDPVSSSSGDNIFSMQRGVTRDRNEMVGAVPLAADLLSGFYPNALQRVQQTPSLGANVEDIALTREDYELSVRNLMGDKDSSSSRSESTPVAANQDCMKEEVLDPSDFLDTMSINSWVCPPDRLEGMETMSRNSWMKSMQSIDDVSMSSGNVNPNPGCNVEPSYHESWTTAQFNNITGKRGTSVRSDSMSTLNTNYLESIIPSQSNPKKSPGNKSKNYSSPPILMNKSSQGNFLSPTGELSLRPTMFTAGQPSTGVSQVSMLSDMTDLSFYRKESMRSLTMRKQKTMKSDTTMSDMSEALASLKFGA